MWKGMQEPSSALTPQLPRDKAGQKPFPALRYTEQEPATAPKPTTLPLRKGEVIL